MFAVPMTDLSFWNIQDPGFSKFLESYDMKIEETQDEEVVSRLMPYLALARKLLGICAWICGWICLCDNCGVDYLLDLLSG